MVKVRKIKSKTDLKWIAFDVPTVDLIMSHFL